MMAGALIGALRVTLGLDTAAFTEGLGLSQKKLNGWSKSFSKAGADVARLGATMSLGITAPFAAFAVSSGKAAVRAQEAVGQVNAALKSMGNGAGFTSEQLQKMGKDLEHISAFDDKDILKKVTANMLTFGNISGDAFVRAQRAAVDLSARLGQDLQASTIMVGKALNDPIKGLSALRRVGIQFTSDQESMITKMAETGDIAGAQAIMLQELERQFKGAGQAARDAAPGSDTINKWSDLQERMGKFFLELASAAEPVLNGLLDWFESLSPGMQTFVVSAGAVAAATGPMLVVVGSLASGIGALLPLWAPLVAGLAAVGTTITATVIPAIGAFLVAIAPIAVPLAAVAAAVGAVYLTWKNWDTIEPILRNLYEGVKKWTMDKLSAVFNWLKDKLKAVGQWFYDLYDKVVGHSYYPDMVDGIISETDRLQGGMVEPIKSATDQAADQVKQSTGEILQSYAQMGQGIANTIKGIAGNIKSGDWVGALGGVLDVVKSLGGSGIFGGGSKGGDVGGGAGAGLPGFATGGSFTVGGMAGIDKNLVAFRATKGERVDITPAGRRGMNDNRPAVVQLVVGEGQVFEPRVQQISGNVSVQTISETQARANRRASKRI